MKPRVTDIVRNLVSQKRYKSALRYAKKFRLGVTEEEQEQMTRAFECMCFPSFYESIEMNVEEEIEKGVDILVRLYGSKAESDDFGEILDAIDVVCLNCPEDTLEDNSCCDGCSVRKLYDSIPHERKERRVEA